MVHNGFPSSGQTLIRLVPGTSLLLLLLLTGNPPHQPLFVFASGRIGSLVRFSALGDHTSLVSPLVWLPWWVNSWHPTVLLSDCPGINMNDVQSKYHHPWK